MIAKHNKIKLSFILAVYIYIYKTYIILYYILYKTYIILYIYLIILAERKKKSINDCVA